VEPWEAVSLVPGSSVLATLISLLVVGLRERWRRDEELLAAKRAIQAEVDSAAKHAKGYLVPKAFKAVGWRASTLVYESVFPKLLSLSAVTHEAADALINFYQNVGSFNRSLDQIAEHHANNRPDMARAEVLRAEIKAMQVTSAENLRAIVAMPDCEESLRAEIRGKLERTGNRTLYDEARFQMGLV
jgi:hypothetical protein